MKNFIGVVMALVFLRARGGKPNNGYCLQDSCFTLHAGTVDFNSATKSCESKQGTLMTVRTTEVNDGILDILAGFDGHVWIGLIHRGDSCADPSLDLKGYTWVTGDSQTRFKNWKSNAPVCSQQCVSASKDDAKWTERLCNDTKGIKGYLCEHNNTNKCERLTSKSTVLYETSFEFSRENLAEVPNLSNATRMDLGTKHICLEGKWLDAPWNCEVYRGGCEHKCDKKNKTFICTCPPGYKLGNNAVSCEKTQHDPCRNAGCSHTCLPRGNDYECLCHQGFALDKDGKTCKDINECEDERQCLGRNVQCINTIGSFECLCMKGFKKEQNTCEDDDECESAPCEQECINTVGSYYCECWEGYKVLPEDKHKCERFCAHQQCLAVDCDPNIPSQCNCPRGFILEETPMGLYCTDIDECDMLYCDQECYNTFGGYICSCYEGYKLSGTECLKILEGSDTTTISNFTPAPTDAPTSFSAGVLLAIIICIAAVILLVVCLAYHNMKCCGKTDSINLDKVPREVHDLQQVNV
ncbi:thrombomodulin [Hoplias malabaricus]|uniref:thrombomodulin n=1 Tax=Hoplias malabaricus TaxID=27720 RepID=UPI00346323BC